ncbi:RcpC/CpaB family pilus assembly protein [Prescottella subtropica]|uniref:RcpC/CpaB family pilus assembly protein n=1 Tax=Prescottella subtropica TaxID=2545757 RepID=UPI0010F556B1|nr:RcpC/CpaB family pilus assembly protein [Prescottella subtropica]
MAHEPPRRRDPHGTRSLAPSPIGRLGILIRPDRFRTDTTRRVAAGVLVLIAVALFVRDARVDAGAPVIVAARDLVPGDVLTAADVRVVDRPGTDVPQGIVPGLDGVTGHTVASPVRDGEILTDVRLLGPRLAAAAGNSPDARMVPVRLSDTGLADMIREGDRVDVLTVRDPGAGNAQATAPSPTVLASDATVVLVSPESSSGARRERVVMLALPAAEAGAVAAASLTSAITVTLH